jgi:hypothetical protein
MGIWAVFSGIKPLGREVEANTSNVDLYLHFHIRLRGLLLHQNDNFTFTLLPVIEMEIKLNKMRLERYVVRMGDMINFY